MRSVLIFLVVFAAGIWARRENYTGRQRLVGYWGQNGAGPSNGPANYEKPLDETCRTTKYDIIAVGFVNILYETRDIMRNEKLPTINLANHCARTMAPQRPFLLRCPAVGEAIKECQRLGKKVIMSVGGDTCGCNLGSPNKARKLAQTLYDMFLGGSRYEGSMSLRPFGNAVMDGIDLDIESGTGAYYDVFIKKMRELMDADQSKVYLLTGAPQCPYPDFHLNRGLQQAGQDVDHLYIQFYNNYCSTGGNFHSALKQWLNFAKSKSPRGPLIFIGLPAATKASNSPAYYRSPSKLQALYQKVRDLPGIGGIMLWDASWDQNNVIAGKRYSEYAFEQLKSSTVQPTGSPGGNTQRPTRPPTRPPTQPTAKPPVTKPSDPCIGLHGAFKPHPTDCHKFFRCNRGKGVLKQCGSKTAFNPAFNGCDYPENVPSCG